MDIYDENYAIDPDCLEPDWEEWADDTWTPEEAASFLSFVQAEEINEIGDTSLVLHDSPEFPVPPEPPSSRRPPVINFKFWKCKNPATAHQPGYIYLVEAHDTGVYKIGRTVNLSKRITTFEVVLPFPIDVRHAIKVPDMACAEKEMHLLFKDRRLYGEWFKLLPHEVELFCSLGER